MAVLAAAQLLDELMGRHRNINPNEKTQKLNWEDPEYCIYYMVKFCPHDLFVNTRADLGSCPKIHDDEVKELYEKAEPSSKKSSYQEEFMRFCQNLINDVERKIEKGEQRLLLMNSKPDIPSQSAAQTEKDQEQIKSFNAQIAALEKEAETAGMRGDVEEAQKIMKNCDKLKEEKAALIKQSENNHWNSTAELAAAQEKQMEVCPVCAAFLIVGDAQQRIDDHLMGKQHVGYYKLRQAHEEMQAEREKLREEKEKRRREERERDKDRSTHSDRSDRDRSYRGRRDVHHRTRSGDDSWKEDRSKEERSRDDRSRSHRNGRESSSRHDKDKKHRSDRDRGREHSRDRHDSHRRHRSRSHGRNHR